MTISSHPIRRPTSPPSIQGAGDRHRADARRVRDDRARPAGCTSTRCSSASTARGCASWPAAGRASASSPGPGPARRSAIRPDRRGDSRRSRCAVGVVNREREATPETPTWNVVIVTTGIARRWFEDDLITRRDTHRRGRDPPDVGRAGAVPRARQARRLPVHLAVGDGRSRVLRALSRQSAEVLETTAFDPAQGGAGAGACAKQPREFLDERFLRQLIKERRGVAVFVPTRARGGASSPPDWERSWPAPHDGVLPRRRADPGASARFSRARANRPSCSR